MMHPTTIEQLVKRSQRCAERYGRLSVFAETLGACQGLNNDAYDAARRALGCRRMLAIYAAAIEQLAARPAAEVILRASRASGFALDWR